MNDKPEADHHFLNRPSPKAYNAEFQAAPPPSNPVLRGLVLQYLAQLVASSSLVQNVLWTLNGFGKLRDRAELDDVDPRYEPVVIRTTGTTLADQSQSEYLTSLASEDWTPKRPLKSPFPSALDYHEAYVSGRLTPLDVAEALLPLIRRDVKDASKHSTAFLSTRVELVRKAAEESTARYRAGKPLGPLDGVPVAVKDEEDLAGYSKSLGSRLDFTNREDVTSFCVKMWVDAGAVCVGKTTMHEIGLDTSNCNPIFGTPLNPNNAHYYCGGSSGGSAYAVSAGLLPFAMGNDGGGSVRIPASYCGLFGLKTSHGRISIRPSSNLAKSTGVAGPLAANMVDLELAYRVMAQPDALDATSSLFAAPRFVPLSQQTGRKKVLGIFNPWFEQADAPVQRICRAALDYLVAHRDYSIVDITLPLLHDGQLAHAMTILAEVASGIPSVRELTAGSKILVSVGKKTPAIDFLQAQKVRNLLMRHLSHLFEEYPGLLVVTPTTPNAGWHINPGDLSHGLSNGNQSLRNMAYAWLANFTGCPALSVPAGYADPVEGSGRVPVGLMAMAEWGCEDALLAFGYDAEAWLHEGLEGGRARPETFVDVLGVAGGR